MAGAEALAEVGVGDRDRRKDNGFLFAWSQSRITD
jgi:hypothetical protein